MSMREMHRAGTKQNCHEHREHYRGILTVQHRNLLLQSPAGHVLHQVRVCEHLGRVSPPPSSRNTSAVHQILRVQMRLTGYLYWKMRGWCLSWFCRFCCMTAKNFDDSHVAISRASSRLLWYNTARSSFFDTSHLILHSAGVLPPLDGLVVGRVRVPRISIQILLTTTLHAGKTARPRDARVTVVLRPR